MWLAPAAQATPERPAPAAQAPGLPPRPAPRCPGQPRHRRTLRPPQPSPRQAPPARGPSLWRATRGRLHAARAPRRGQKPCTRAGFARRASRRVGPAQPRKRGHETRREPTASAACACLRGSALRAPTASPAHSPASPLTKSKSPSAIPAAVQGRSLRRPGWTTPRLVNAASPDASASPTPGSRPPFYLRGLRKLIAR